MIAGQLEIQLLANMARLQRDMNEAKSVINGTVVNIEKMVAQAKTALTSLGAVLSVSYFTSLIKGSIDAMDSLDDLNRVTKISVEQLSGLRYAAQIGNTDLNSLSGTIAKLSQNIGQNREKFQQLGITASDPLEAFKQLSDLFSSIEDPQLRAALGAEALGKQWQSAAVLLSEGGEKIGQLVERGQQLSGVTQKMAEDSGEFNDKMLELTGRTAGLNSVVGSVLPLLNVLLGDLIKLRDESGNAATSMNPLTEILKVVIILFGNVSFVLNGVGKEIGGLAAQIAALASGDLALFAEIGRVMKKEAEENRIAFDAWEKKILAVGTAAETTAKQVKQLTEEQFEEQRIKKDAAEAKARALVEKAEREKADKERKAAAEKFAREEKALWDQNTRWWIEKIENDTKEYEAGLIETSKDLDKWRANEERLLKLSNEGWIKKIEADIKEYEDGLKAMADKQPSWLQAQEKQWEGFVGGIESGWRSMWDGVMNGTINSFKDVMKSIGSIFMRTLTDLAYQAYLKPIMLNIVGGLGQMFNLSGLQSAASAGLGNGQTAGFGNLSGLFGGGAGLTNPFAAGAIVGIGGGLLGGGLGRAMDLNNRGMNIARIGGALLGGIPGALLGALFGGRNPENQNFRFTQGTGAGSGLFGGIGAEGSYSFDLEALRGVTGGLDARILRLLGGNESAGTAALAAYTAANRRMDGQPAQFAFPEGDETAAEQIAKELLQSRYGTLFGLIDQSIADQVKNFSGTSTELQTFIVQMLDLFDALSGTGIKGLNIDTLRAMSREGEALGDTLTRVTADLQTINALFVDETTAYASALKFVQSEFDAMGVKLPITVDSFRELRSGLDLSTEAGRNMFDMLVRVAPAMQQIEQAAQNMLNGFNASMGSIFGSSFTRGVIERQATGLISQFQSMTGLLGGVDPLAIFRNIPSVRGELEYLFNTGGPELQGLLNQILGLYTQYASAQETVNTNTVQMGQVTSQVIDRMLEARSGLREWIDSIFLNDQLSPLSPMQKLEEARRQYETTLGMARAGDVGAVTNLSGASETYLRIARDIFASSAAYNDIFRGVMTSVGSVAGISSMDINARIATAMPTTGTLATGDQVEAVTNAVQNLLLYISQGISVQDPEAREAIAELTTAVGRIGAKGLIQQS